jgi:MoxR-like ATPase
MTGWWLSTNSDQPRDERWRQLPRPAVTRLYGPDQYIAPEGLVEAINTAILLGQALLLTGEPGCGKTEVGNYTAWKLGLGDAIRFDVKSTTAARDLFYGFDTIGRFHAAQERAGNIDPLRFVTFQGLGLAILYANEPAAVADLIAPERHPGRRRSVVLIDEIDKAPRDVANDLLTEFERMQFYITEIGRTVAADPAMRPIVVITSNSERGLPAPFLRRCVYYNMDYPGPERLKEIVAARIGDLPRHANLVGDCIQVFGHIRTRRLQKQPGTAELLAFILALQARGCRADDRLAEHAGWEDIARHCLLKDKVDQEEALRGFVWPAEGPA